MFNYYEIEIKGKYVKNLFTSIIKDFSFVQTSCKKCQEIGGLQDSPTLQFNVEISLDSRRSCHL